MMKHNELAALYYGFRDQLRELAAELRGLNKRHRAALAEADAEVCQTVAQEYEQGKRT